MKKVERYLADDGNLYETPEQADRAEASYWKKRALVAKMKKIEKYMDYSRQSGTLTE